MCRARQSCAADAGARRASARAPDRRPARRRRAYRVESAGETGARTADARGRRRASGRDRWRREGHGGRARPRPAPPPPRSWSCRRRPCPRRSGIRPPASPLGGVVLGVGVARAVVELHLDADDPHLARRRRRFALALAALAQAGWQIALAGPEPPFGDPPGV